MIISNSSWIPTYFNVSLQNGNGKIKKCPFNDDMNLEDYAKALTGSGCSLDQWMESKNDIKTFIVKSSNDLDGLDQFFTTLIEWGMEKNPRKMMAILVEMISLDLLTNLITAKVKKSNLSFTNHFDLAIEHAIGCPEPLDSSLKGLLHSEWKKCRPIVVSFIPNLLNIFFGAFNFLDSKKFTTLWEKYLLLEIVYKFFLIPYCLIQILQPILIVKVKVHLVATLIIATSGILMSCYQRWLKPLPDEIVNCTNLDKQMEKGGVDPKIGKTEEVDRLIAALEVHDSVLLRALSGEGKTALIHHFIHLKHQGELPEKLQKLNAFEVDCGLMISNVNFGHSELINQTKDQMSGNEDKFLLFFDDFYQLATNKAAFLAFKKRFLEDKPRCKSILAVTLKEWDALKNLDEDHSFRRKVYRMKLVTSTDEEIKKIVLNYQRHFAQDVFVTTDAINTVVNLSAKKDYLPDIGRAAKAEEIFKTAIGKCRAALNHHYGQTSLSKNELEKNRKLIQKIKKVLADRQDLNLKYDALSHQFKKAMINAQAKVHSKAVMHSHQEEDDSEVFDPQEDLEKEEVDINLLKKSLSEKDQIFYLWHHFYATIAIEKLLEKEIANVHSDIPIQVNKSLIESVYDEISELESEDGSQCGDSDSESDSSTNDD